MVGPFFMESFMIITLTRGQIGKSRGVDITIKSARGNGKWFAPTWDMVMGHKHHTLTNEEYTEQYLRILDKVPNYAWNWLASHAREGKLNLLCYCPGKLPDGSPKFCHTKIAIAYMVTKWPNLFTQEDDDAI